MKKIFFILCGLLLPGTKAQVTYDGPAEGAVASGIIVNTSDFNNLHSSAVQGFNVVSHTEPAVPQMFIQPGSKQIKSREFLYLNNNADNTDSVLVFRNFDGIPETSTFPPDPYIAAGPDHLLQVVNRRFRITDKEGSLLKEITAEDWFAGLIPNSNPFDPKVIYDHYNNRWVMVWLTYNTVTNTAYYLISVSDDNDPIGTWFNWALPANMNGNNNSYTWADYEGVGFDGEAIYITSSQFSFSGYYQYDRIRIIENSSLYTGGSPGQVTYTDLWNFTYPHNSNYIYGIRPVRMQSVAGKYYFVHVPTNGANFITVLKLSDPVTNPVLTGDNVIFDFYYVPENALQRGGPERIEGGGCHLRNEPVFQNGYIHIINSIKNSVNGSLSSLQYLCIDPVNNDLNQNIELGDDEHFYFYPSLAVDKYDNSLLTYSRSAANEFAGAYFTLLPDDTLSQISTGIIQEGQNYYFKDGGTGRNRWGDYSGAWIDPSDTSSFWIMTEYVAALNTWGTKVGGILYNQQVPVELISFNYALDNNDVRLNWKTATETNNQGFRIERKSSDKKSNHTYNWEQIGFIEGHGTTTEESNYTFTDYDVKTGRYYYRLKQSDYDGSYVYSKLLYVDISSNPDFYLAQNYPNPFNPATNLSFVLGQSSFVSLKVYDILGHEVATLVNGKKPAGKYEIIFKADNLSSGVYLYQLRSGNSIQSRKMILFK